MTEITASGYGATPQKQPQQMQPWERIKALQAGAQQLQMLQTKQQVLLEDLFRVHPDHSTSPQGIHQAINKAESSLDKIETEISGLQWWLYMVLGEPMPGFAISVDCGDKTICLCDEGSYLCARDLVSVSDHIDNEQS